MVCLDDGIYKVAGIVSWGYSCAESYSPGVYTSVPYYIDWIQSVLRSYDPASTIIGRRQTDKLYKMYR